MIKLYCEKMNWNAIIIWCRMVKTLHIVKINKRHNKNCPRRDSF